MRYASAAAAERRSAVLARQAEKTMRNRRDKCINTLEPEHLNRRVLIGKRLPRYPRFCQRWIGFSEDDAKSNHRRCIHQASKPHFWQSVEDNALHPLHAVFCGFRARLTSNRITK